MAFITFGGRNNNSNKKPMTSTACGMKINKNGLYSLSSFDAAKGIFDSILK